MSLYVTLDAIANRTGKSNIEVGEKFFMDNIIVVRCTNFMPYDSNICEKKLSNVKLCNQKNVDIKFSEHDAFLE